MARLLLILSPLLLGLTPTEGVIALTASPDTTVTMFPRTDPVRVDLMVAHNLVSLGPQIDGVTARHLLEIDVTSIGGGTWFLAMHLADPGIVVVPEVRQGRVLLRLRPGRPELVEAVEEVSIDRLLQDPPPRRPAPPQDLALTPLRGDASTIHLRPIEVLQDTAIWQGGVQPAAVGGWWAVDEYRHTLTTTDDPSIRAAAHYRLGLEHLGLGWYREASYYLEETLKSADEVPINVPSVALAAARAQLVLHRSDRARQLCHLAAEHGADGVGVLVCLGTVALTDGHPSPTHVGRALKAASPVPDHQLLAAQLLQQDHRNAEARRILEALAYSVDDGRVHASLGDSRFATGDVGGAKLAWGKAAAMNRRLQPQLTLRVRMAEMIEDGPSEWASRIPILLAATDEEGPVAAEAHYLLAQVAQTYGDPDLAAEHLNRLWDRYADLAEASDVPERLMDGCRHRLDMLEREGRIADHAAFFTACWRPELDEASSDPALLERTAGHLSDIGLPTEALALQLRAMAVHTRLGQEDPGALTTLTQMYAATGRAPEALQTLDYAETLKVDIPAADFLMAEAHARLASDDVDGALRALALAEAEGVAEARRAQGMIYADQGDCRRALRMLEAAGDDEAHLARGRCLVRLGRDDEAVAVLPTAGDDPLVLEDAAWLLGVVAARRDDPLADRAESAEDDRATAEGEVVADIDPGEAGEAPSEDEDRGIWAALQAEEVTAAQFEDKLDARRR